MKKSHLILISNLLSQAAETFSNHGCNDMDDSLWEGISPEERKEIALEKQKSPDTQRPFSPQ